MQQDKRIFFARKATVNRIVSASKIDGVIFFDIINIRYLSGFTGSDGVLIITENKTILLVDGRYITQAKSEALDSEIFEYKDKIQGIVETVQFLHLKYIGFEAESIVVKMYNQLLLELTDKVLVPLAGELKMLRVYKDEAEISLMRKAAQISSSAICALSRDMKSGSSEKDLALQLEILARQSGADQLAFDTIVAFGENSALPHATPTDRKLKRGDFIVIDFGIKYYGYCSDETCTFAYQDLTKEQKNVYELVKKAHDLAIEAVQAGVPTSEIDRCVRNIFGEKYEKYFSHGTGHGVGMEVHEAPKVAPTSREILEERMVVTVEPGLYFPGLWGIRIEDTVLVRKNSCEKLTKMDKELIVVE
jgi:Xaa-Pro aminopeptidase